MSQLGIMVMYTFEIRSDGRLLEKVLVCKLDVETAKLRYNVGFVEAAESVAVKQFKQHNPGFGGDLYAVHCW